VNRRRRQTAVNILGGVKLAFTALAESQVEAPPLLSEGHSYKSWGERLALSLDTVRFRVRQIYEQLHVHSKSEAARTALSGGRIA
jgi:DNA-binding NarL/FixJ family response regulator